jgi:tetratricopeptide (TPR) repeat protein
MSTGHRANTKFVIIASLVLVLASSGLAALWPLALRAAHAESQQLLKAGERAHGAEAADDFLLATRLDSSNHPAYARLADTQIAAGQADAALASLSRAGQGSDVEQLKVRTLIELGRTTAAANEAITLTEAGRSDDDIVLGALALATAGRQTDAAALTTHVTAPEAAGRIARATASQLTLATELSATGLLNSSSVMLGKLPASYERNLLLARIRYTRQTDADLAQAADLLTTATALNPAGLDAHQLLAKVYRQQNHPAAAAAQDVLASKLTTGRP